jgi:hypothetical protein
MNESDHEVMIAQNCSLIPGGHIYFSELKFCKSDEHCLPRIQSSFESSRLPLCAHQPSDRNQRTYLDRSVAMSNSGTRFRRRNTSVLNCSSGLRD